MGWGDLVDDEMLGYVHGAEFSVEFKGNDSKNV